MSRCLVVMLPTSTAYRTGPIPNRAGKARVLGLGDGRIFISPSLLPLPSKAMTQPNAITYDLCLIRFMDASREYIGPGKRYSYQQASDALGFDVRTVKAHVGGESMPELNKLMRYMAFLGDAFVNRLLRLAGYDGAHAVEGEDVDDFTLNAEVSELMAKIGVALRDGRIDHTEWPGILCELEDVVRVGKAILAKRDGAHGAHASGRGRARGKGARK